MFGPLTKHETGLLLVIIFLLAVVAHEYNRDIACHTLDILYQYPVVK